MASSFPRIFKMLPYGKSLLFIKNPVFRSTSSLLRFQHPIRISNPTFSPHLSPKTLTTSAGDNSESVVVGDELDPFYELLETRPIPSAHAFAKLLSDLQPISSVDSFNQLLSDMVSLGHLSTAALMFDKMSELNLPIDVETINTIIYCYCRCSRVGYGFALFGRIIKLGFVANEFTHHTLIRGLLYEGKPEEANKFFTKLMRRKEIANDLELFETVVDACYLKKEIDDYASFCESGLFIKSVRKAQSLILKDRSRKQMFKGLAYLEKMLSLPLIPKVESYNFMLQGLFDRGNAYRALDIFGEMETLGVKPNYLTYKIMITGLCKENLFDKTSFFFHKMGNDCLDRAIEVYNSSIDDLLKAGKFNEAIDVFNDLVSSGHVQPNGMTYTKMILGLCTAGLPDEVRKILIEIESNECLPDYFKVVCRGFSKELSSTSVSLDQPSAKEDSSSHASISLDHQVSLSVN